MTVEQAARNTCSTGSVRGLSEQIIAEARVKDTRLLTLVTHPRIRLKYSWVFPYLQPYAAESLLRVVGRRKGAVLVVASCLRVLPGQWCLYQWYRRGRCNIKLAAPPGSSNHELANAVDVESPEAWLNAFKAEGWRWLGKPDPPHFDRASGRSDVDNRMCAAFQRLSNKYAGTKLTVDGNFGAQTEAALKRAPAKGWEVDMQEDVDRVNIVINGTPQSDAVKAYLINNSNTVIDASDWAKFASYAPPTYDPRTQTLYMETAKIGGAPEDQSVEEDDEEPAA